MFVLTAGICVGIALSGTAFAVIYGALSRLVAPERRSWALAVAGAALQGATRNPLGDPGLLGLSAGAGLAVAAGMALGVAGSTFGVLALAAVGTLVAAALEPASSVPAVAVLEQAARAARVPAPARRVRA